MSEDLVPLMDAYEVAAILKVAGTTVQNRWRVMGLPGIKLPSGGVRFHPDDIAEWIKSGRTAAKAVA